MTGQTLPQLVILNGCHSILMSMSLSGQPLNFLVKLSLLSKYRFDKISESMNSASGGWFEALMMEWFYKDPSNNIQGIYLYLR